MLQANHRRHALLKHLHEIADVDGLQAALDALTAAIAALSLTDLDDVTITTPVAGQQLVYNGSQWVNGQGGYPAQLGHMGW